MKISEEELILQLLSNEPAIREKSWAYIYKANLPIVKEMVIKLNGSGDDAAGIFQDGLLILNRNLRNGSYGQGSSLGTYLYGICRTCG